MELLEPRILEEDYSRAGPEPLMSFRTWGLGKRWPCGVTDIHIFHQWKNERNNSRNYCWTENEGSFKAVGTSVYTYHIGKFIQLDVFQEWDEEINI